MSDEPSLLELQLQQGSRDVHASARCGQPGCVQSGRLAVILARGPVQGVGSEGRLQCRGLHEEYAPAMAVRYARVHSYFRTMSTNHSTISCGRTTPGWGPRPVRLLNSQRWYMELLVGVCWITEDTISHPKYLATASSEASSNLPRHQRDCSTC